MKSLVQAVAPACTGKLPVLRELFVFFVGLDELKGSVECLLYRPVMVGSVSPLMLEETNPVGFTSLG